ncbi:hypothetical protein [Burkholderia pseudomallei]|uniref:hypothetical protein n=1 Tax=Burkholderia pseudomallei TaxID=28450 RepID=UPI000F060385|nr:hypothetical protein [Burkholderia pseudomallei]MWA16525.1 hypothetical protein [Burkholderia pseudomallei]VBQ81354.1 Uncharacterised protein [Burkholderia pseudomallei]
MKKPTKAQIAQENVSRLASIGLAALEYDHARAEANAERKALIAARKLWSEDPERSDDTPAECERQYALSAKKRTTARSRLLRQIARHREWLCEVNA